MIIIMVVLKTQEFPLINTRDYFAANCPESFMKRELDGNFTIIAYKRALFKRGLIGNRDLNDGAYHPSKYEISLVECLIRFEYADLMMKAGESNGT